MTNCRAHALPGAAVLTQIQAMASMSDQESRLKKIHDISQCLSVAMDFVIKM
jgi:hypothetical protein